MNVYAPYVKDPASAALPVMLFLHGGAFMLGSGILYDGSNMAALGNVIVVSTNYRLGSFGFLASESLLHESGTTGNYAIQDQRAAINWLRANIVQFGGDPDQLTVFGESAGATSACHHVVSPQSQGLLQRALMQSGICHALELKDVIPEISLPFYAQLNCSGVSGEAQLLECLRSKTAEQVLVAQTALERPGPAIYLPWFPIVDGFELKKHPYEYIEAGEYNKVPFVIGVDQDEYSHFMCPFFNTSATETEMSGLLAHIFGKDFLPVILQQYPYTSYKYPVQMAIGAKPRSIATLRRSSNTTLFLDALSDSVFKCPGRHTADIIAATSGVPVFLYSFNHDPGFNRFQRECFRVAHAYELPFLFPAALLWMGAGYQFTVEENQLSMAMMQSWAQFAKTGDPSNSRAQWVPYDSQKLAYTALDAPKIQQLEDFRRRYCKVWP